MTTGIRGTDEMTLSDGHNETLVFRDEDAFFRIIQTTPDLREAIDLLRRARHAVLKLKLDAVECGEGEEDQRLSGILTRLNDEVHYQTCIQDAARLGKAADLLFGAGAWNQIVSLHKALVAQARAAVRR